MKINNRNQNGRIQSLYEEAETQYYINEHNRKLHERELSKDPRFCLLKDEIIDRRGKEYFNSLMEKQSKIGSLQNTIRSLRLKDSRLSEKAQAISSDSMKAVIDDSLRGFHWHTAYKDSKKVLQIVTNKNNKVIGTINLSNYNRKFYIHYRGCDASVEIPESYDRDDSSYDDFIKSVEATMSKLVRDAKIDTSKQTTDGEESVDTFTGIRPDESGVFYHWINGKKGEVASDSDIEYESQRLNEANLQDLINDSKATDEKRIKLASTIYTDYKGVDSDGTLIFESDSQTRSGLTHRQRVFYPGFFDLLDTVDAGEKITEEQVVDIITNDLMVDCSCESFLYYAWAYKSWTNDYGLMKEVRKPQRNNVKLKGGACKHVLSVLDLINRSNTLFEQITGDLNTLFQKYKKRPVDQQANSTDVEQSTNNSSEE